LTKCDPNGNFTFTNVPDGSWGVVVFDQWLDLIVDGSSRSVNVSGGTIANVDFPTFTWQTHLWTRAFMDVNGNGIQDDPAAEPGLLQVASRIRMRNGRFNNFSLTDITGSAAFNETFPLFNWYVVETDTTRFNSTGVHVVNDAGGKLDASGPCAAVLNSTESFSVPTNLRVPGAVYCSAGDAACATSNLVTNPTKNANTTSGLSTARVDPADVVTEGWQGGLGEYDVIDWGKQPYSTGENGGIRGHTVYSSTRPFDDPAQLFQNLWEPLVPGVTINLYQEMTAPDGTTSLVLIDTTKSSSWDAWAQGFTNGLPNMTCPGQDPADAFFSYTMAGTTNYLTPTTALPNNSQYKCYDGYHNLNQIQPAPYDGLYQFPTANCKLSTGAGVAGCIANPNAPAAGNLPAGVVINGAHYILPQGKYVVEEVTPPNYEVVKEEDKNILIGDNFIAPATSQFAGLANIFIIPDQATINNTNPCFGTGGGCTNPTTDMGRSFNVGGFGPGGLIVMPT